MVSGKNEATLQAGAMEQTVPQRSTLKRAGAEIWDRTQDMPWLGNLAECVPVAGLSSDTVKSGFTEHLLPFQVERVAEGGTQRQCLTISIAKSS